MVPGSDRSTTLVESFNQLQEAIRQRDAARGQYEQANQRVDERGADFARLCEGVLKKDLKKLPKGIKAPIGASGVIQEFWLVLLRQLADNPNLRFTTDAQLTKWLTDLLEHRLIDETRKQGAQKRSPGEELLALDTPSKQEQIMDSAISAGSAVSHNELSEILWEEIRQLENPKHQAILILDANGRLDTKQTAEALGIDEKDVARLRFNAKGQLSIRMHQRLGRSPG